MMNKTDDKKHHLISENLYKVLHLVKQYQNQNISTGTFRACITQYEEEIQKMKNPKYN